MENKGETHESLDDYLLNPIVSNQLQRKHTSKSRSVSNYFLRREHNKR